MKEKDIQRINELYNLDKSIGLTPEQKEEQRKLRHEYIQSVRANLRAQLNNVSIKNEEIDHSIKTKRIKLEQIR